MASPARHRRGVVTGAGSGIGKAVALRLLGQDVEVLAVDIDETRLAAAKEAGCRTIAADLAEPADRARLAEIADGYDYLVNSHGIILIKPVLEVTLEDWRRIQTVNSQTSYVLQSAFPAAARS